MLGIAVFVMALAGIIANPMVQHAGLMGASVLYLILMLGELVSGVINLLYRFIWISKSIITVEVFKELEISKLIAYQIL